MKLKIIFLLAISIQANLAVAQAKRNKTPKVVYMDNPKATVDCLVIKIRPNGAETKLGKIEPGFVMEKTCNAGVQYRFHPLTSNYRDNLKYCNIKDDTVFLVRQEVWATLWSNSYLIPRVKDASKQLNGLSAVSSQMLLSLSDENRDSLIDSRNRALKKYYGDMPSDPEAVTKMLGLELDTDPRKLMTVNYADVIIQSYGGKPVSDPYTLSVYYFEGKGNWREATRWALIAEKDNPSAYWVGFQKAKLLRVAGDKKGTIALLTISLEKAQFAKDVVYVNLIKREILVLKKDGVAIR